MNWFKFYGAEYLSDPKMLSLSPCERSCWVTLLCYASINDGVIKHITEWHIMTQAGIDALKSEWGETEGVLERFKNLHMITVDNDVITVLNWKKRQEVYSKDYERLKRWREKKRLETLHDNGKNRIDKIRIDKSISINDFKKIDDDKQRILKKL